MTRRSRSTRRARDLDAEHEAAAAAAAAALSVETMARIEALKASAASAFREGRHGKAEAEWGEALVLAPDDATLYSNRSAAEPQLGRADGALADVDELRGAR